MTESKAEYLIFSGNPNKNEHSIFAQILARGAGHNALIYIFYSENPEYPMFIHLCVDLARLDKAVILQDCEETTIVFAPILKKIEKFQEAMNNATNKPTPIYNKKTWWQGFKEKHVVSGREP